MRLAIVGSRRGTTRDNADLIWRLVRDSAPTTVIVTGDATGVDALARNAANGFRTLVECHAAWDSFGRGAGPIRNAVIAEIADECVAFPDKDSKGTIHCIEAFRALGKMVRVFEGGKT